MTTNHSYKLFPRATCQSHAPRHLLLPQAAIHLVLASSWRLPRGSKTPRLLRGISPQTKDLQIGIFPNCKSFILVFANETSYNSLFFWLREILMAVPAAILAVSTALDGFPVLLIPNHRPDDQDDNHGQCQTNNPCSHISLSPFYFYYRYDS